MIELENITMADYKRYLKQTQTIVFPFGTIEEHGRHLPLNTDALTIKEVLKRASCRKDFFMAPLIYYGVCTTTGDHPGTIGITPQTLRHIASDLVRDSFRKGLRNFLLISGHGGSLHMSALKEAAEMQARALKGASIAVLSPYDVLWKEFAALAETPNDSHAGEIETSIMLYLAPELVKGRSAKEFPKIPKPFICNDYSKYWKGGVWGNPGKASVEKGREAVRLMVMAVEEVLQRCGK
ncbi:MAG TPA: creatininase family protein [Dissulfurispiraceae bacterium]|nr:creatininase family protein [Dissulfurispiraceae bacterium]